MIGLTGFALSDGGVCLSGDVVVERMAADEAYKKGSWPWSNAFMQGDVRAAVAWPDREIKSGGDMANGCVAVAVLDPAGDMRVVTMQSYDLVSTGMVGGVMREGLAVMLRDLTSWGIRQISVQSDDAKQAESWWAMVRKDPACTAKRMPVDGVGEIDRALTVFREMATRIITPRAYATAMEQADARGEVTPAKKALAMLALSYKFQQQRRVRPEDTRWQGWN